MRRVRSQLNNLAQEATGSFAAQDQVQQPIGFNRQTDEVQRRLESAGFAPNHHQNAGYITHPASMQQGNNMYNQPQYHPHFDPYAPPPHMPMQPQAYHPAPQPAGHGPDLSTIKLSLERLASKLQGLGNGSDAASSPNNNDIAALKDQNQHISNEMTGIKRNLDSLFAKLHETQDGSGLKRSIEQNHAALIDLINENRASQIDPEAYAKAVETSHADISAQVEALREIVNTAYAAPENLAESLKTTQEMVAGRIDNMQELIGGAVTTSYQEVSEKLNEMIAALQHLPDNQSGSGSEAAFASLEPRLEEISRAILALSSANTGMDNLERIEARIAGLTKIIDERQESTGAAGLGAVTSGIDELRQAVSQISDSLSSQPSDHRLSGLDEIASTINKLSEKIDNFGAIYAGTANGSESGNNDALIERLDALVERVESVNVAEIDPKLLNSLETQLSDITTKVDTLSENQSAGVAVDASAEQSQIMEQLQYISSTVHQIALSSSEAGTPGSYDQAFQSLGQQMQEISERLANMPDSSSPMPVGEFSMEPVTERLVAIEQQLGASRDIAVELASEAAQDAVQRTLKEMPAVGGGADGPAINQQVLSDLSEEFKSLREKTESINASNLQTLDAVKDIFASLSDKIGHLEGRFASGGQPLTYAASPNPEMPNRAAQPASADQEYVSAVAKDKQVFDDPNTNIDAAGPSQHVPHNMAELDAGHVTEDFDDMPLEPGSGGPDLAALVKQANDRSQGRVEIDRNASGNDFLSAARKAMQAHSGEEQVSGDIRNELPQPKKSKSLLGRILPFYESRKPLILGIAIVALLLALSAPLASRFLSNSSEPAATNEPSSVGSLQTDGAGEAVAPIAGNDPSAETASEESVAVDGGAEAGVVEESETESVTDNTVGETGTEQNLLSPEASTPTTQEFVTTQSISSATEPAPVNTPEIGGGTQAFKNAIEMSNPKALFEVGRRYTEGAGVEKDMSEAARWYERSAALGFAPAQYIIGNFYEKGIGVNRSPQKAAEWYEQAARNGNIIAMHNLAVIHASPGVLAPEPDMKTAFNWFQQAANHGVRDSQVNVGIFYTNGAGDGKSDLVEAYKWFAIATKAGDKDAESKRDIIANAMRPDQKEQARAAVENWKPQPANPTANDVTIPDSWKDNSEGPRPVASRSNQTVKTTQAILNKLGYDAGPADGIMGNRTRDAIIAFQTSRGIPANGQIDENLVRALEEAAG